MQRAAIFAVSLLCALIVWTFLAWWVAKPAFLPSPVKTFEGAIELVRNGELLADVAASFARIIVGFALVVGIAFGGVRILAKRIFPERLFDRPQDVEFISLHLSENGSEPKVS